MMLRELNRVTRSLRRHTVQPSGGAYVAIVTQYGVATAAPRDIEIAGARFSAHGRPINLNAHVLMDLMGEMLAEDSVELSAAFDAGYAASLRR